MLYLFEEVNNLTDDFPVRCQRYLSAERALKALSYRFLHDRKLSVSAYLLLRLALREVYGIDESVSFSYGKNGKPYLRDYPDIHFNLSHCKCAAACAVSCAEIGVDVEEIVPVPDELARRVIAYDELIAFKNAENPPLLFCEFWVAKESYLKKTGVGIGADLTAVLSKNIREKTFFKRGADYCGCVSGTFDSVRRVYAAELSQFCEDNDESLLFRTVL